MSASNPKRLAFEQFAAVARALGNGHRLELLDILVQGERSVDRLAEASGLSVANASQHLQHLWRARLVTRRRAGTQILYAVSCPESIALVRALWKFAECNVSELQRIVRDYYRDRDSLEPMSRDDLMARIKKNEIYVLDVRPSEEYAAGHLPGAVSIPLDELKRRLKRVPKGKEIVACCRGPYCVYAYDAVSILRKAGYSARRLQGGFMEWREAGLPVESSIEP